jgi:hypothetical protein
MSIEKTYVSVPAGSNPNQPSICNQKKPHAYQKQEVRIAKKLKRRAMLRSQGIYKS